MKTERKQLRSLTVCAAFAFALLPAATSSAQPSRLNGQVVDADGKPLSGVEIVMQEEGAGPERNAKTKKNGRFTVFVERDSQYLVKFSKEGFADLEGWVEYSGEELVVFTMLDPAAAAAAAADVPETALPEEVEGNQKAVKAFNQGAEHYAAGDLDKAQAKFQEALDSDPDLAEAAAVLSDIELRQDANDRALELADRALANQPENTIALAVKHDALVALDRRVEANALLDDLVRLHQHPNTARRVYNGGVWALRQGDVDTAERRFKQAVEVDSTLLSARVGVGQIEFRRGSPEAALSIADEVLATDPQNAGALRLRMTSLLATGDEDGAAAALTAIKDNDPQIVATLLTGANDQFNAGDTEGTLTTLRLLMMAAPDNAQAHYLMGLALANTDPAQAKIHLARFVELAPDHPEAGTAREMIQFME